MTPTDPAADRELLRSLAGLYADLDPAPDDLADGVLARLGVEGLDIEYELLTLVEGVEAGLGARGGVGADTAPTIALAFAGSSYRVLVRVTPTDEGSRIDGWVIPTVPMRVFLGPAGQEPAAVHQNALVDGDGRFEFSVPMTGEVRLWLLPQSAAPTDDGSDVAPLVTPPFTL